MTPNRFHLHAVPVRLGANDALPTEFRLFARGENQTEKGSFIFDDAAAASVMAAYRKWGVDLAIDLEHQMLGGISADPTARDARGWCKLQLRNGELWAVDVRWTPDGAERLSQKRQRYVSPAFEIDPDTRRIEKVLNIAITAMPATHNTPALVAASMGAGMDPKQVGAALDALIAGDSEKCAELLKGLIAAAAADPDATTEDAPPPVGDGGADEMTESAVPAAPPADAPADAPMSEDDKKKAAVAAASVLVRLSGKDSLVEALAEAEVWRQSHITLETERQALAAERAMLEAAERREGCAKLVKLAGRAPATVWADDKASAPKKYLASMPIADFREYVADAIKSAPAKSTPVPAKTAPDGGKVVETRYGAVTLSARELKTIEEVKGNVQVYAETKALKETSARRGA